MTKQSETTLIIAIKYEMQRVTHLFLPADHELQSSESCF